MIEHSSRLVVLLEHTYDPPLSLPPSRRVTFFLFVASAATTRTLVRPPSRFPRSFFYVSATAGTAATASPLPMPLVPPLLVFFVLGHNRLLFRLHLSPLPPPLPRKTLARKPRSNAYRPALL